MKLETEIEKTTLTKKKGVEMHHCGPSTTEAYPLLLLHSLIVHMTPWGDLDCGLRFSIVSVLGIGIAHQFLSSIVLGIVLVYRPWYSPSLHQIPQTLFRGLDRDVVANQVGMCVCV